MAAFAPHGVLDYVVMRAGSRSYAFALFRSIGESRAALEGLGLPPRPRLLSSSRSDSGLPTFGPHHRRDIAAARPSPRASRFSLPHTSLIRGRL
ncbi:hypothetical protein ZWY2020_002627 [Hordeum vulgare]|nr:hypothetical protein ZWY2020_002627 [Hordeum vulgare]